MDLSNCPVCDAPLYDSPKNLTIPKDPITDKTSPPAEKEHKKRGLFFPVLIGSITVLLTGIALWEILKIDPSFSSFSKTNLTSTGPTKVSVLGDTFLGYSTLWAKQFRQKLQADQITIDYADELNQNLRSQRLSSGEVDFMVTTINQLFETPSTGKIVAMWDWTRGADRLVLNNKRFPQIQGIQDLNKAATQAADKDQLLSIILAGDTPSEYLSLLLADKSSEFSLEKFNIIRVDDSSTAWERFQNPQSGDNIAAGIFWEPHVTQAIRRGYIASLSSRHVQRSIVDVVVASPQVLKDDPGKVQRFVKAYYEHIGRSSVDKTALRLQFEELGELSPAEALNFLQGVYFFEVNCANHWMNGPTQLLETRLQYTARVLYGSGRLSKNPNDFKQFYDGRYVAALANSDTAANCPGIRTLAVKPATSES